VAQAQQHCDTIGRDRYKQGYYDCVTETLRFISHLNDPTTVCDNSKLLILAKQHFARITTHGKSKRTNQYVPAVLNSEVLFIRVHHDIKKNITSVIQIRSTN
jgi:hypothetical protein